MEPFVLPLLFSLLAFRLTYLFARDIMFQPIRNWLGDRDHNVILDMIECFWCLGTYMSLFAAVAALIFTPLAVGELTLYWIATAVAIGYGGATLKPLEREYL